MTAGCPTWARTKPYNDRHRAMETARDGRRSASHQAMTGRLRGVAEGTGASTMRGVDSMGLRADSRGKLGCRQAQGVQTEGSRPPTQRQAGAQQGAMAATEYLKRQSWRYGMPLECPVQPSRDARLVGDGACERQSGLHMRVRRFRPRLSDPAGSDCVLPTGSPPSSRLGADRTRDWAAAWRPS